MQFPIIPPYSKHLKNNFYSNMFHTTSSLLYLLSSVSIIFWIQSGALTQSTNYDNSYNTLNPIVANLLKLGAGVINFLNQGQRYLNEQISDITPQNETVYDFIVVGAGTAGATVAARLSEIPQIKVLLIEAGPNENSLMDIPILVHFLQLNNDINWKYQTKSSNKYCLGMEDNSCNWPRGKVMGGSSVLNYMIASRGGAEDYDKWAEMGNDGWAYKDVLRYFKKIEAMKILELQSDTKHHGTQGPLHITYPKVHTLIAKAFLEAGKELGYPLVDYNADNMIGFSYVQTTIQDGARLSSNQAYLKPARNRNNLYVTRESMVREILIDRRIKRAVGVKFIKYGRTMDVFARNEVILCAGAIGSPQLLMLSGIGPANHLIELGINVVKDAPVGENLMDHVAYGGLTFMVNSSRSLTTIDMINPTLPYIGDYLTEKSGPFAIPGGCEALAFINTKNPEKRSGLPDMELLFTGGSYKGDIILSRITNLNVPMRQIWDKYIGKYGWTILPMLLKPKSRGRIKLRVNDVNVKPEIVPNYFDDPEDVRTMIAGIKAGLEVSRTKAMQVLGSQLANDTLPGCENFEYNSNEYWECAIRTIPFTIYHYSGTCKMGSRNDSTAVVDPRLKVIGVERLRVADASIMPEIISAHTNIPVYMIAEKLADMIKEDWGYSKI